MSPPLSTQPVWRRSIGVRVLAPTIAVLMAIGAVGLVLVVGSLREMTTAQLAAQCRTTVRAIEHAAETSTRPQDLERFVRAIGAEPGIELIVVTSGSPPVVIASTKSAWVGLPIDAITPADDPAVVALRAVAQTRSEHVTPPTDAAQIKWCAPVQLIRPNASVEPGAVLVCLDASGELAGMRREVWLVLLVYAGAITASLIVGWVLIGRHVIRPVDAMVAAIERRQAQGAPVNVPVPAGSELGLLAEAINQSSAQAQQATDRARRLALIAERTTNMVVITDAQRRIVWVNKAFESLSGYTLEEVAGRVPGHFLQCPDSDSVVVAEMRDAIRAGRECRVKVHNRDKQGRRYLVDIEIQPLREPDGTLTGFMAIESDVTEQEQRRQEMLALQRQLQVAAEVTRTGWWELPIDTMRPIWSPVVRQIHEVPDDFVPDLENAVAFYQGAAAVTIAGAIERSITTGEDFDVELPIVTYRGNQRWVRSVGHAVTAPGEGGRVVRLAGAFQDITELVTQRERLREQADRLDVTVRAGNLGTWDWYVLTGEAHFNDAWCAMLGYDAHEIEGSVTTWNALLHPDDRPGVMAALTDHLEGRSPEYRVEFRMRRKQGGWCWVLSQGRVIARDQDGRPVRVAGVHVDINAAREAADALERARRAAEEAARAKSEFLANMSHEIRTPMTAILGFADVLAEDKALAAAGPGGREALDAIDTIRRNGRHLLSVINDILDLSKIEAGKMAVESVPTDPAQACADVVSLMRVRADAKSLALDLLQQGPIPRTILTDPVRLKQILTNLVGNAIKFTETGSVRIHLAFEPAPDAPTLRISVEDTGIGMTTDQLAALFTAFHQADSTTTRRFGGTGLGLAISGRLAEAMGGTITVHSQPGRGSRFTLTLPVDRAAALDLHDAAPTRPAPARVEPAANIAHRDAPAARPLEGLRILVAEDGPDNQRLILAYLTRAGAQVRLVENGRLAVEAVAAEHSPPNAPGFDLVIMDMQMPEMDGYTATRALRAAAPGLPVIALTAHAMPEERERCFNAGCVGYATKPIDRAAFIALCSSHALRRAHAGGPPAGSAPAAG